MKDKNAAQAKIILPIVLLLPKNWHHGKWILPRLLLDYSMTRLKIQMFPLTGFDKNLGMI